MILTQVKQHINYSSAQLISEIDDVEDNEVAQALLYFDTSAGHAEILASEKSGMSQIPTTNFFENLRKSLSMQYVTN